MLNVINKFRAFLLAWAICLIASISFSDVNYVRNSGADVDSCGEVDGSIPEFNPSPIDNKDSRELRCYADADALKITLYKIAICREEPNTSNPALDWDSKCVFIINEASPIQVEVDTVSDPVDLNAYADLTGDLEATYTHFALLIGNELQTKMKKTFGQKLSGRTSTGTNTGTNDTSFCYSIDGATYQSNTPTRSQLTVECVENESQMLSNGNYGFSSKVQDYWGTASPKKVAVSDGASVYLMSDATSLATIDTANKTSDANFLIGVKAFGSPVVIDGNTNAVDLGFQLTNQGQVRLSTKNAADNYCSATNICVNSMRNFGVGFRFTTTSN